MTFRTIQVTDSAAKLGAGLVSKYSWGENYPMDPLEEIKVAEYIVGAFDGEKLVGFATITKVSSPDGIDNGKLWFAVAVVVPEYRSQGIYTRLYEDRLLFFKEQSDPVAYTCTDNPIIKDFLLKRDWTRYRIATDESGGQCTVFQLHC